MNTTRPDKAFALVQYKQDNDIAKDHWQNDFSIPVLENSAVKVLYMGAFPSTNLVKV